MHRTTDYGKGDAYRPVNRKRYESEYDRIFQKQRKVADIAAYAALVKQLVRYCYWYYVKCEPIVSDYAYDMAYKAVERIEQEFCQNGNNVCLDDDTKCETPATKEFYEALALSPTCKVWGDRDSAYPEWAKVRKAPHEGNAK